MATSDFLLQLYGTLCSTGKSYSLVLDLVGVLLDLVCFNVLYATCRSARDLVQLYLLVYLVPTVHVAS